MVKPMDIYIIIFIIIFIINPANTIYGQNKLTNWCIKFTVNTTNQIYYQPHESNLELSQRLWAAAASGARDYYYGTSTITVSVLLRYQ